MSNCLSNRVVYLLLAAMIFLPNDISAKLRVTKASQTKVGFPVSTNSRNNTRNSLYCEGYKTYITSDSQGKTLVYVNDDGGDYSTDVNYLVETYDDDTPVDWSCVDVYGGKKSEPVTTTNIKMDGGSVRAIHMMGYSSNVTSSANLTVTGGVISFIEAEKSEGFISGTAPALTVNISLSNLRYSGSSKICLPDKIRMGATTVFVNNDCEFYSPSAKLTSDQVSSCKGAIIPDTDDPTKMIALGEAYVPANTRVECDQFENKATNITFGTGASIYIRKCDGLVSGSNSISSYSNITQRAHNQIKQVSSPATCTYTESYRYYCDLCGYKTKTYGRKSISNHNYVVDEAIEATCCSPGLTEGKHCTKCGRVAVAQTEIAKLGHDYTDYVDKEVCTSTFASSSSSTKTAKVRMCKTCYTMEMKVSIVGISHTWKKLPEIIFSTAKWNHSTMTLKQLATTLQKKERKATCTRNGLEFKVCTTCGFVTAVETSALNHKNAASHEAVAATCETAGNKAYSDCGDCGLKIDSEGKTFNDLSDAYLAPLGHKYGESASYVESLDTKVSDATCSSPAVYHQTCANSGCGHVSEDLVFYGEAAKGHQYQIKSIDYKDPFAPEDGILTLTCGNCSKDWPCFAFEISKKVGNVSTGGYWTKCQLVETKKLPTCIQGWGKYHLTLNYKGTKMEAEYENNINPCGYLHNYDDDGVCHEKHYQMKRRDDGSIVKTYAGTIQYKIQEVDGEDVLIEDTTEYRTKGYLLETCQKVITTMADYSSPLVDPETGENMYYTDYKVTNVGSQQEMIEAINAQKDPFYAGTYFDWTFYDDDPLYEQYSAGKFSDYALDFDLHGHKINRVMNTYHIVYKVDGQVYKTVDCKFGSAITLLSNPTKEGYTFSGWSAVPATMPKQDIEVTGTFKVNSYKLIYKVDGKEYKTTTVTYGSTITPEAAPTKEGYTFSGWSAIPSTMPAKDVTVTGTFKVNSYKLIYKVDGKEYKTTTVTYGATIIPEAAPTKEGYTFSGWSTIPSTMPAKDVTVTGTFKVNSYKLIYKVDGQEYKSTTVTYGSTITPEAAPTKEGYTFSGWSTIPSTMPAKDVTITGTFKVNSYKLIYMVDGVVYKTITLNYGATITPEAAPTKEGYTFSGWSTIPSTMPAKDVTVTGTFKVNSYKLIYKVDGQEYKSTTVTYGSTITPEAAPTKEGYTFSGWSTIPSTMPAKDVTITGTFKVNSYKLIYMVDGVVYKTLTLNYGATITPEAAPTKEGYTFSGWSAIPSTMPAKDVTVTGSFADNCYFLTYMVDGEVYKSSTVTYGSAITPEPAPTKEGYTFSGWSTIPSTMPAKDVTVTGTFKVNSYKLIYMVDGVVYKTITLNYGSAITPEPAPTKEGYTFSGWSTIPSTMPAKDVEVTGTFTEVVGLDSLYEESEPDTYYDLQGRKVQNPRKGQIYLLNGKRMMYR